MKALQYGFVIAVLILLQVTILPFMAIGEITPDLLLIGIIVLAMREGSMAGMIAAVLAGLCRDAFSTGFLGSSMLALVIAAFLAGSFAKVAARFRMQTQLISLFGIVYSYFITYYLLYLFDSDLGFVLLLFWYALPAAVYSFALMAIVHYVIRGGVWGGLR